MIDKEKLIQKLDKWYEARMESEKFGIIGTGGNLFQMKDENLFKIKGLEKSELVVDSVEDSDYPFKASLCIGKYCLFTLLTTEEYAEYFPEKIKKQGDFIVIDGVKYRKEV
ncbi:hypothetical protein [Enterococcus olivae]